jgi:hypothetical protein
MMNRKEFTGLCVLIFGCSPFYWEMGKKMAGLEMKYFLPIVISMVALGISSLNYYLTRKKYDDRQVKLYYKLSLYLLQVKVNSLDLEKAKKAMALKAGAQRIKFNQNIKKYYLLESEEEAELATLQLLHVSPNEDISFVALKSQVGDWFGDGHDEFEENKIVYAYLEFENITSIDAAIRLLTKLGNNLERAIRNLKDEMPLMLRNKIID